MAALKAKTKTVIKIENIEDRIALNSSEAAKVVGCAPSTLVNYARDGKLRIARYGKRVIIPISALEQCFDCTIVIKSKLAKLEAYLFCDVARMLGLSKPTIRAMIRAGIFQAEKQGNLVYIKTESIDKFLYS